MATGTSSFLLLCFATIFLLSHLTHLAYSTYFSFPDSDLSKIQLQGDASISKSSIQLTQNLQDHQKKYSCGRAIYNEPVHLWDSASSVVADFATNFTFVMRKPNTSTDFSGDGIAFFIAPNGSELPHLIGGSLGLFSDPNNVNLTTLSVPTIAVELDTYSNSWDPAGEIGPNHDHVGIDVNSIKSRWTNFTPPLSSKIGHEKIGKAFIYYNASTNELRIYLSFNGEPIDANGPILTGAVNLSLLMPEWVGVGLSASTGFYEESHEILSWEFSSNLESKILQSNPSPSPSPSPSPGIEHTNRNKSTAEGSPNPIPETKDKKEKKKTITLVVLVCLLAAFGGIFALVWLILWRKKAKQGRDQSTMGVESTISDECEQEGGPRRFSFNDLSAATNDFSDDGLLGKGGFGSVHKGFMFINNLTTPVAVKRLSKDSKQGRKEFVSEVRAISRLRHKNLVKLIGWCHEQGEFLLVYQFMPNGSLDAHLFGSRQPLPWRNREKIIQGLASALLYLHEGGDECVLHRDIKSSNVMLDSTFNAKLGDFGLARLVDHDQEGAQTSFLGGSYGYLAPECFSTLKTTKESDIYSFGIVALEVACGRRPIEPQAVGKAVMVEWVWSLYGMGSVFEAADARLNGEFDEDQMMRLIITGLWCAHPDPDMRPSIQQVMSILLFKAPLPNLPPQLPMPEYRLTKFSNGCTPSNAGLSQGNNLV